MKDIVKALIKYYELPTVTFKDRITLVVLKNYLKFLTGGKK